MEVVKTTDKYTVFKKRNGRYGVKANRLWVNGEEKVKILSNEGFIKLTAPAAKEEATEASEESAE